METCIQCTSEVNLSSDTFTLYQVDGSRYLYCELCKSPKEPHISPAELSFAKRESDSFRTALKKARRNNLILLVIGCVLGYLLGAK